MYVLTALFLSISTPHLIVSRYHEPFTTRTQCELVAAKQAEALQNIAADAGLVLGESYLFEMRCDPKVKSRGV